MQTHYSIRRKRNRVPFKRTIQWQMLIIIIIDTPFSFHTTEIVSIGTRFYSSVSFHSVFYMTNWLHLPSHTPFSSRWFRPQYDLDHSKGKTSAMRIRDGAATCAWIGKERDAHSIHVESCKLPTVLIESFLLLSRFSFLFSFSLCNCSLPVIVGVVGCFVDCIPCCFSFSSFVFSNNW